MKALGPNYKDVTMTATGDAARLWFPPVYVDTDVDSIGVHIPNIPVNSVVNAYMSEYDIRKIGIPPYSLDTNLLAYWILDKRFIRQGETAYRDLVAGYELEPAGTPTPGESNIDGTGLLLNGTTDYLEASDATVADITTGDFSVMVIFKATAATAAAMMLVSKRDGVAGDGQGYEVGFAAATSKLDRTLEDADSTTTHTDAGLAAVDDAAIHVAHWTTDRSEATGSVFYLDGTAGGTPTDPRGENLTLTCAKPLRIGCDSNDTPATFFAGTIYAVAIWGDVRTATEVQADVAGGFAPLAAAAGTALPVCASASDPITYDMTPFAQIARGRFLALRCATLQTASAGPLTARWYFF